MPEDNNSPEQSGPILSNSGVPYKNEQAAKKAMTEKGLDGALFKIASYEDGYAIVPKPQPVKEKYWKVIFTPRSNENDTEDVPLTVNGDVLQCQRGVETIIPNRFKEAADHTLIPLFTMRPNEPRKEIGSKLLYPYSLIGEATEAEYRKMLREGNLKTKAKLAESAENT